MPSAPTALEVAVARPGATERASQQGAPRKAYRVIGCERATTLPSSNSDHCRRMVMQGLLRIIIDKVMAAETR